MSIKTLLEQRFSCNYFAPEQDLSQAQISELIRLATLAPSAYNGQNWRFIAVHSPKAKQQLQALAYGQEKIGAAAVTIVICGRLDLHTQLADTLASSVSAGILSQELLSTMVHYATEGYHNQPQRQRDEAIRSASLAAMSLMLAAQELGLASCPMIGFDAEGVSEYLALSSNEIPVMLVTIGQAASNNWPQKPRKPVHEVLSFA